MSASTRTKIVADLLAPEPDTTEATIQSRIAGLLTWGELNLSDDQVRLEAPAKDGTQRRLDIEVGRLAIEVKRDLRPTAVFTSGKGQLEGYVRELIDRTGAVYSGVLTDGIRWHLYHAAEHDLVEVSVLDLSVGEEPENRLVAWLETVLATQTTVRPTPEEIQRRLGATSPAHKLDTAALRSLYASAEDDPDVQLKRELWARLLRTALGTNFEDSEDLFINHTLLVLYSEIIAHAIVGITVGPAGKVHGRDLTLGTEFRQANVMGVVQADFFDWVLAAPDGERLINELTRRIVQFDWSMVEHDVLKVLYESIIEQSERKRLGEYYTPDWLADRVVAEVVDNPLDQRVMDPSCGSGTFLFHAVRAYLAAADAAGLSNTDALQGLTSHVVGLDVHPVAVALARVTYLLAIGTDRLRSDRGVVSIPVYLGDSLQWEQRTNELTFSGELRIPLHGADLIEGGTGMLWDEQLVFPESILKDAITFDQIITALAERAEDTSSKSSGTLVAPVLKKFGIVGQDAATLTTTFDILRTLQRNSGQPIWGYFIRNLVRPIWLSQPENRVDRLVGNPPWLRYGDMTPAMQRRFTELASLHELSAGRGASGRDLSTVFVVRAADLYLRTGGKFGFVLPHGVLTRQPHARFRTGVWHGGNTQLRAQLQAPWDLTQAATGFPNHSCVVFGSTDDAAATPIPSIAKAWTTPRAPSNRSWADIQPHTSIATVDLAASGAITASSPYKKRFRNGAQLQPRLLFFVTEDDGGGSLGYGTGRVRVVSLRSTLENKPWNEQESLDAVVEKPFVHPVYLGESVVPFGLLPPRRAVLPITSNGQRLMTRDEIDLHEGLEKWWSQAEDLRDAHKKSSDTSTLLERADYHGQFAAQLPTVGRRVVYSKSGTTVVAAIVTNRDALIEGSLYWAPVNDEQEANYLTAILNSQALMQMIAKYQATGLFGPRHIDKNLFNAPIPEFDASNADHTALAGLAVDAARETRSVLDETEPGQAFRSVRRTIREQLAASSISDDIDQLVSSVLRSVN